MEKDTYKRHVAHKLRLVNNAIDRYFFKTELEDKDVRPTHAQAGVMHFLYDHRDQEVYQKDIEECFQISGATASNTLKGMEQKGIIKRTGVQGDARKKQVTLTEKGISMHEHAISNIRNLEQLLVEDMSEEEIDFLNASLEKLIQNVERHTNS